MPLALSNAAEIESLGIGEVIKVFFCFYFVYYNFIHYLAFRGSNRAY
ncbi:Uncharacterised protein [Escherichia coli]|uniref:Uncharacterized protein n=1 Tax=Escherichia coli TaxID=562 RepID=A0A376J1K5_ECOLX|nr:Uncharacterised protein [Escherichia coli]